MGWKRRRPFRDADSVCGDCARKLKEHGLIEMREGESHVVVDCPEQVYHWWRRFYGSGEYGAEREQLEKVLVDLFFLISRETTAFSHTHHIGFPSDGGYCSGSTYRKVPRGVEQVYPELYTAIETVIERPYRDGVEHGLNLLGMLASGELSIHEFEVRSARAAS